jgi:hypothetical protein
MPVISLILKRPYSAQTPKSILYKHALFRSHLVRRRTLRVQEDDALLDLDVFLAVARLRDAIVVFLLRDNLDFDAIDTSDQFGFENGLALLLAELVAGAGAAAVDTGSDGDAIHFECLVAVDSNEDAVQTSC